MTAGPSAKPPKAKSPTVSSSITAPSGASGCSAITPRQVLNESVEFAQRRNQPRRLVVSIELANGIGAHGTSPRKRAPLPDNIPHPLQQNKLQPLVERHRVRKKGLPRPVGRLGQRLVPRIFHDILVSLCRSAPSCFP